MASSDTATLLIQTIKRERGLDSHMAHAYAVGMLSVEVSEKTMQEMIESLTRKAN